MADPIERLKKLDTSIDAKCTPAHAAVSRNPTIRGISGRGGEEDPTVDPAVRAKAGELDETVLSCYSPDFNPDGAKGAAAFREQTKNMPATVSNEELGKYKKGGLVKMRGHGIARASAYKKAKTR